AFSSLTKKDCYDYIYNLTINRTFDGFLREKSVVNDGLAKIFTEVKFEESPSELDHAGDIDYLGYVTENTAFGIQIKPVTAQSNFGNYSVSERMKASFESFENDYKGKVFIVYSLDGEIANKEIIEQIKIEIERQKKNASR
ncbi:MAG: MjaI family restriction endonuclease, partial [Paludibacter sp.]|nr:MjaI family restriction endonuclease [Paludibacter sp.]